MNKIKIIALSMLAMAVVFSSCKKDDDVVEDQILGPTFTVAPDAISGWYNDAKSIAVVITTANELASLTITTDVSLGATEMEAVKDTVYDIADFDDQTSPYTTTYSFTMPTGPSGNMYSTGDSFDITVKVGHKIDGTIYTSSKTVTVTYAAPATTFANEVMGAQLYNISAPTGLLGAYDLVNENGVASIGSSDDKDMNNFNIASDWTASWDVPSNGTMWVKATTDFSYADASDISVMSEYALGSASNTVNNVVVGDVYIAKLRGGDDYAVVKITEIVDVTSNEDYIQFDFKKQ